MKKKDGSVILILVIISAIILLYFINGQQSAEFLMLANLKKYKFDKQFRVTESLCNFAIVKCFNNFDLYIKQSKEQNDSLNLILYNGLWPANSNKFKGLAKITVKELKIVIESQTFDQQNKDVCVINCCLLEEEIQNPNSEKIIKKINLIDWQVN